MTVALTCGIDFGPFSTTGSNASASRRNANDRRYIMSAFIERMSPFNVTVANFRVGNEQGSHTVTISDTINNLLNYINLAFLGSIGQILENAGNPISHTNYVWDVYLVDGSADWSIGIVADNCVSAFWANCGDYPGLHPGVKENYRRTTHPQDVDAVYTAYMNRLPTQTEKDQCIASSNGPSHLSWQVRKSEEAMNFTIATLYRTLLFREPDASGLTYYKSRLVSEYFDTNPLIAEIKLTPEYLAKHPS